MLIIIISGILLVGVLGFLYLWYKANHSRISGASPGDALNPRVLFSTSSGRFAGATSQTWILLWDPPTIGETPFTYTYTFFINSQPVGPAQTTTDTQVPLTQLNYNVDYTVTIFASNKFGSGPSSTIRFALVAPPTITASPTWKYTVGSGYWLDLKLSLGGKPDSISASYTIQGDSSGKVYYSSITGAGMTWDANWCPAANQCNFIGPNITVNVTVNTWNAAGAQKLNTQYISPNPPGSIRYIRLSYQ